MNIFHEETIKDLLILSELGENRDTEINDEPTFTRKLIFGKVLIERWGNVMSDILIHTSKADFIFNQLSKNEFYEDRESMLSKGIWGANIYAVDNIPENKALLISLDTNGELVGEVPSRAVSSFTI